jgi:hypothetical protein
MATGIRRREFFRPRRPSTTNLACIAVVVAQPSLHRRAFSARISRRDLLGEPREQVLYDLQQRPHAVRPGSAVEALFA